MKKIFLTFFALISIISISGCKSTDKPVAQVQTASDDEYSRSTAEVKISREEFNADKAAILKIISEMSVIMVNYDYDSWIKYIEPDSVSYWSNRSNLSAASKRLPIKGQKLSNLNDYFRMVFVPARKGHNVDEIRYISIDQVKAVQVREDQDVVYYNFIKVDGKWMVRIPPLNSTKE